MAKIVKIKEPKLPRVKSPSKDYRGFGQVHFSTKKKS